MHIFELILSFVLTVNYRNRILTAVKWSIYWLIGIGLVSILIINLNQDPFVIGKQTRQIEEFPFSSVGVTLQGAVEEDYYHEVEKFVIMKMRGGVVQSEIYKNWTIAAAYKLTIVIYQLCDMQKTYLRKQFGMSIERGHPFLPEFDDFLEMVNSTKDDEKDSDIKDYVIPSLLMGLPMCSDMIQSVYWNNKEADDKIIFKEVVTDGGITCVANTHQLPISQRIGSLKYALGYHPTQEEIQNWKNVNFDLPVNDLKQNNSFLIQKTPGRDFGMSFIVQEKKKNVRCMVNDGNGFLLTLAHPRDIHRVRQDGRTLQFGYEHFVRIYPQGRFLDSGVSKLSQELRNCCLETDHECKSNTAVGPYSQIECLATCLSEFIFNKCNCTTIGSIGLPGRELCDVKGYDCYLQKLDDFSASQNKLCKICKPSCNDVRYFEEITSVPLSSRAITLFGTVFNGNDESEYAVIHVFYGDGSYEVTITKLKRLFSELIGITTGMFGSAVELTLPKFIDICYILFGITGTILAFCWRKCRPLRRRMRTYITQAQRLIQPSQIEPDMPIPIEIIVSSSTNLVEQHTE